MLTGLVGGIPPSADKYIQEAMDAAFSDVNIQTLSLEDIQVKIRLASSDTSIVVVVLDNVFYSKAKTADRGLFSDTSRFHLYKDDKDLVEWLNREFGCDIEVENIETEIPDNATDLVDLFGDEVTLSEDSSTNLVFEGVGEGVSGSVEGGTFGADSALPGTSSVLLQKIEAKDAIIENLKDQLSEAVEKAQEGGEILKLKADLNRSTSQLQEVQKSKEKLEEQLEAQTHQLANLKINYEEAKKNEADSRNRYAEQSSILRDKTSQLDRYKARLEELEAKSQELILLKQENDSLRMDNIRLEGAKSALLSQQGAQSVMGGAQNGYSSRGMVPKTQLTMLEEEIDTLKSQISDMKEEIIESDKTLSESEKDLSDAIEALESAKQKIADKDEVISDLNQRLIESAPDDADEVLELKKELASLKANPFLSIANQAYPNGDNHVSLMVTQPLSNINFIFVGTNDSQKDMYTNLKEHLDLGGFVYNVDPSKPMLVVDMVTESQIDYCFRLTEVKSGLNWLEEGGDFSQYITSTNNPNVKVLSLGLKFINDFYFITVDWAARLMELSNSGFNVFLVGGILSGGVSRVLYENFSKCGPTQIVLRGSITAVRNTLILLRGMKEGSNSSIVFLRLQPEAKKLLTKIPHSHQMYLDMNNKRVLIDR